MRKQLLTWMLSVSVIFVNAQEVHKKTLTFEEAVKIALQNGVLLNQQKNNLELNQIQNFQYSWPWAYTQRTGNSCPS